MFLVFRRDALKYAYRVRNRRLIHLNTLEAPLKRGILLDGLVILLQGRRTDTLKLTARKSRLENVCCVHRTLGATSPDHRMDLVQKEYDVAASLRLIDYAFKAFLELSSVLGTGDHPCHIQRHDTLGLHLLGNLATVYGLSQPLGDGCLSDTSLAYKNSIVLGAAGKDLYDTAKLFLPSYNWVQPALASEIGKVASKRIERWRLLRLAVFAALDLGSLIIAGLAILRLCVGLLISPILVLALRAGRMEFLESDTDIEQKLSRGVLALTKHSAD